MSNESAVWKNLTEPPTELPLGHGVQDGYVLQLVLLSIFLAVTLVLLSILLITCRRCWEGDRWYSRFIPCKRTSDDPEKTTTTSYTEESHPVPEITIRVDESDCLSAASFHDMETERFLSTGSTGRRVSFNEAALFDHSKKAQEKGRRYTLTEGDFHHLKNARLTHLHLPPAALKIVTIHECESSENSIAMTTRPVAKSSLSIFQPPMCTLPQTSLASLSPSSALPGDALNSTVDEGFRESPAALIPEQSRIGLTEVRGTNLRNGGSPGSGREIAPTLALGIPSSSGAPQSPMLHFFTKLRRHASLEGASPYLKIKRWKFDSSQRASSLDTRGSPKRRPFLRQRAASESMDEDEHGAHHIDLIQYIARTKDVAYCPPRLHPPPSTPPPSLGRLEVEVMVEPSCSRAMEPGVIGLTAKPQDEPSGTGCRWESTDPQSLYHDIWTLRASLEQYISSDQSSNNDKDSVHSDTDSVCSLRLRAEKSGWPSYPSQDLGDGLDGDTELSEDKGRGKSGKQDSMDSEKGSEGESSTRRLLQMDSGYASIEAPCRGPDEFRLLRSSSGSKDESAMERIHFFTCSGHKGTVCESFDTDILDEEIEDEPAGASGISDGVTKLDEATMVWMPYGQMFTQSEAQPRVSAMTCRDYSIDEKTDALFHEFLRHDPQYDQQESPVRTKHQSRVHLRKRWQRSKQYSDPGQRLHSSFDRYRTPLRRGETVNYPLESSYHSRLPRIVSSQDEDNSEAIPSLPDKADQSSAAAGEDTSSSKADQTKVSASTDTTGQSKDETGLASSTLPSVADSTTEQPEVFLEESGHVAPPAEQTEEDPPPQLSETGYGPQTITAELSDKLALNLEDRLYSGLRRTRERPEGVLTATHASPDHSPV
ncbi:voltage-dependent calcium channel beta subunit-associated regulatory protein [Trichomycterus rosablanca]|uniref:voltage-dependent calcium channel beta subunit-associated regulatory protein n=1 Tax=Trichomycterus rosablanca TaxID=2290929 RepID=UPI002F3604CB